MPLAAALLIASLSTIGVQDGAAATAEPPSFAEWLEGFRAEALDRGITAATFDRAFANVEPVATVIERDRTQAELTLTLEQYLARRLTRPMLRTAGRQAERHRTLLGRVSAAYGVPPSLIVAIWGLESNFGRFSGVRPTIATLATLAYDPRRAAFFREELFHALLILERGYIDLPSLKGSWAGAMGQTQFMPTSFIEHAVDFDGDGRRDIWHSEADVFGSIANYVKASGWVQGERWGREVLVGRKAAAAVAELPRREGGCRATREMTAPLPLARWQALGVRLPGGRALPRADMDASLVQAGRRSFLVYRNYDAILTYNCAHAYGLSVGLLSDRIR
jgi:membrane-bound lytic murein transglycosylase B